MNRTSLSLALTLALLAPAAFLSSAHAADKPELGAFGVDLTARDTSVKPGDDFARYANGHWIDTYQLKDYESDYGSFDRLSDRSEEQVRAIIMDIAANKNLAAGSDGQKIRDLYASYMDQAARDAKGASAIAPQLNRIAAIDSMAKLVEAFGHSDVDGSNSPVGIGVDIDRKNPDAYLVSVGVGGLGLPDKDYYTNQDERFVKIRAAYVDHIAKMLEFAGQSNSRSRAEAVLALETRLAAPQWERAERRNRDKTYNLTAFADLSKLYPGYDFAAHFKAQGMPVPDKVNVPTPSAVAPVLKVVNETPLDVWRDYLTYWAMRGNAPFLSKQIDEAAFAFTGTVLSGQTAQREPWKRAVGLVGGMQGLGEAVGKVYVERHFSPESKKAMDELVENLRAGMRQNIERLDWMGADTKAEAYKKLASFRPKIGYPSKWRDYSALTIVPGDLMANMTALRQFAADDDNRRVGKKTDRDEWFMTPQTINAYYNPQFNEIVFPAAILQAPFFDVHADPAVNYGGIGAVIGHEMGHGFDDQGSKSDWQGIQRNWWTDADRANFQKKIDMLGKQFDAFCPLPNTCVNGKLTMGENIGDLGGLSMAYTAYQLSLKGKPAPVIDGMTGDQRFFMGWAQVWKGKYREEALVNLIKTNPHSPPNYRINGPFRNLNEWYEAFGVKAGDKLYLAPEDRVRIW
ncbi:M13 family metallopeptidase [Arenimonas sp.]|uniref:M13 family metallopeptidase n=1 Tax=Arenimonas sp. TaxID=1872635 RepID=UPI0039E5511B